MDRLEESYLDLLDESFPGIKSNILQCKALGFSWSANRLFLKENKDESLCHVGFIECPILIEGKWHKMGALHVICTKASHRQQGLATQLIQEVLDWAKTRCDMTFLITGIPNFYERFSFRCIQEHRFICPALIQKELLG